MPLAIRDANLSEGNIWLKNWAEVNDKEGHNPHVWKYISIYFGLGIGSSALVVVQTLILWVFCSIKVSTQCTGENEIKLWRLNQASHDRHQRNFMREWCCLFSDLR